MAKRGKSKRKIAKAVKAKLDHRVANEDLARAMHGLRSSNAAQPHVQKQHKGTRSSHNRAAINLSLD